MASSPILTPEVSFALHHSWCLRFETRRFLLGATQTDYGSNFVAGSSGGHAWRSKKMGSRAFYCGVSGARVQADGMGVAMVAGLPAAWKSTNS